MRNEILKIFWFGAFTLCSDVFSSHYNVRVENNSLQQIVLSKGAATSRKIEIVDISKGWSVQDFLNDLTIEEGKHVILRVNARPCIRNNAGKRDSIAIKIGDKHVDCEFKHNDTDVYVYPTLAAKVKNIFTAEEAYMFDDGHVCTLTQDRRGSGFTLRICTPKQSPNNSAIGQQSAY